MSCREPLNQISQEYRAGFFIIKVLQLYEAQFPNTTLTNLEQLFRITGTPYPARIDYSLRPFRNTAGFTNSVYEKYVFPTRFKLSDDLGEIVLLNAHPFPNATGQLGRVVISTTGKGLDGWQVTWFPEKDVQQIFRDAGQTIPKPVVSPPVQLPELERPPPSARISRFFADFAANLGIGSGTGRFLMYGAGVILASIIFGVFFLCWRQRRE